MTANTYIPQRSPTDAEKPQTEGPGGETVNIALGIDGRLLKTDLGKSRWNPATPSGRRWNEHKATHPCRVAGCPHPRYVSPAGWVNLRCREHEAALHRERWAASHPDSRPYRRRSAGVAALAGAVASLGGDDSGTARQLTAAMAHERV
jgi:hypothetical protein